MLMVDVCMLLDILDKHCVCTPEEEQAIRQRIEKESIEAADRVWMDAMIFTPAEGDDVLVWFEYYRYGDHNRLYQAYGIGTYFEKSRSWMINDETGWHDLRVIAWMTLPEPPEENADE